MNDEQNDIENRSEDNNNAAKETVETGNTTNSNNADATAQDDYYAVDDVKKEVLSTIGDGEMHDEGLVGTGGAATDIQSSTDRLTDEQDEAESHDSEQ